MRLTSSRAYTRSIQTPKMPPGLVELMEGLAKDVLKNNPDDLYEFCAGHMQKLLDIRDGHPAPKKPMSLEQKIKKAQEKVRQRIKNRLMQQNEMAKQSNESHEHEKIKRENIETTTGPEIEPPLKNADLHDLPNKPVHCEDEFVKTSEVEIFHEANGPVTASDISHEPPKQQHESELNNVETDENTENEIKRLAKESCADVSEDSLIKPETFHNEECIKEIKNDLKESNVDTEDFVPITSEAPHSEEFVEEKDVVKVDEFNVQPVISESHSTASLFDEIVESTKDDPKLSEIEHNIIESEQVTNGNVTQKTESSLQVVLKEGVSLDLIDTLKSDEPMVDNNTETESKDEEKTLSSLESKTVEEIENISEAISVQEPNKVLDSESLIPLGSIINNKPSQINNDINDADIEKREKMSEANFNEKNATDVDYETNCNAECINDDKKDSKETNKADDEYHNESGLKLHLESKSTVVDNPDKSTDIEIQQSQNVNEIQDLSREIVKYITVSDFVKNLKRSNSQEHFEIRDNEFDTPKVDQNVIDAAHKFIEQERQFSSELLMEENVIILQKTTLTDSKDNTTGERNETNENSAVTSMDLETAAITIQKVFRTFLFSKSRTSTLEDAVNENSLDEDIEKKDEVEYVMSSANLNKERRALGISRMDTVLQTVNEEKSLSQSTDDSSTLSSAATTIQAHVRGFLVRNKLASYKTTSNSSLVNSDGPSTISLDGDGNEPKKTILNIHIVPDRGQFMSRDESILTSIDLPLDNSPPSSVNLHPLGYDKSEPRKQLKREDAIQSVSPPSNNSGKQSEEVDSVKDILNDNENKEHENSPISLIANDQRQEDAESCDTTLTISSTADTVVDVEAYNPREVLSSLCHG